MLYLGYASFFVLHTVCMLCADHLRRGDRALHHLGRCDHDIPMTSLPGRVLRDLRALVPARSRSPRRRCSSSARCRVASSRSSRARRQPAGGRARRPRPPRQRARPTSRRRSSNAGGTSQPRRSIVPIADRRRQGADRQVQRLPVPALPADLRGTTSRSSRSARPGTRARSSSS